MKLRELLLVLGLVAVGGLTAWAAEEEWESLPNGVMGQLALYEGTGGVKVAGYVRKPAGPGPFPLVIVLHGGAPAAKPVKGETPEATAELREKEAVRAAKAMGHGMAPPIPAFLEQGWAVYTIDFRPNPRYKIDALEFEDTVVAVNKGRAFPFVDARRVAMLGGSHGGHVTGRMMTRTKLTCAVLCAPAGLDLIELSREMQKGTAIGANQGLVREMEQRAGVKMAEVAQAPEKYEYTSLLTEAPKVTCPVLMISGKNDPNAPWQVMDLYMDKLRALGRETETFHPDNGPHGFYFGVPKTIPETAESTRIAVAFIKKHFDAAVK